MRFRRWTGALPGTPRRRCILALFLAAAALPLALALFRTRLADPEPTLLLRDRHGRFLGEVRPADPAAEAGYWPLSELPPRVVAATLAVEDRRFRWHLGIDPAAAARAFVQNLSHGRRISGASTVAMQVARMQDPGPRSYARKLTEAATALLLTARYGRERVLAQYLRLAPYGNSIHGIAFAARRYLDKPVEDLSWAETAFLAAVPQAPGRMNPFRTRGREAAIARGEKILDLLRARGDLPEADYQTARQQIRDLALPPLWRRPPEAMHAVLRLTRELRDPARRAQLGGAVLLTTTLDLDLQRKAAGIASAHLRAWEDRGAGNLAVMIVDPKTREVLASVGSAGYFDDRHTGSIDYTRVLRSPGSLLKPFLYALALESGKIGPATILDDVHRGAGGITNADERYLGPLLPRVALANSRNVPAVNLLAALGCRRGESFLRELGLGEGAPSAADAGLGLAIGGMPVTLEQVARAYTTLSGDGHDGDLVWFRPAPAARSGQRVLSEATARQITLFLSDPMARLPSFPRMGATEYPFPVAVKTGTSTNFRDAWTAAYSHRYLVVCWVGHPASRPMDHLSGALSAAHLARAVLLALQPTAMDGLEDLSFPPPRGYLSRRICALTGCLATPACGQVFTEWFPPGEEPVDPCRAHRSVATDLRTGRAATSRTPAGCIAVRSFVELAPRYAAWAAGAGLTRPPQTPTFRDDPSGGMAGGDGRVRLKITQPENGARLLRDPETPPELATLPLEAVVDPPSSQVVWYVDGAPFSVTAYPYTARWPIEPGAHTIEARLPHTAVVSQEIHISVE